MSDFCHIPARQDAIHQLLDHWARWVRVNPKAWKTHPMWAQYRAPRQYEETEIKIELNTIECYEVEKAVSFLPEKHRTAIRWFYVFPGVPVGMVQRKLGLTRVGLEDMIEAARDMLKNRAL